MITMYGIKNCDTIKKARKWLDNQEIEYTFHDYRVDGLDKQWLIDTCQNLDWELVLNKRGTTFRQLDSAIKDNLNESAAIEQMLLAPAMIKRPILSVGNQLYIGFKDAQYAEIFNK
ncbi:ArsC family reductase [uncultured Psychrosphaera sp.]|uniref:ArsC family reductase n=1 Tax=uncultured Psychrosphaera sp. TaxID=1403522 RepID=UPI0026207B06|nr:ArsC family reductase [uncultured Psychrosphaera sp.]